MKTIVTALLTALPLAVAIVAPAAAHQKATTMLRDAAVNHDLEKAKQQFEKVVKKMDASARATYQQ